MKKGIIILSLVAIIGIAAFALFKTLTNNNDGKVTETNPETPGNSTEEARPQGSEEAREAGDSKKD